MKSLVVLIYTKTIYCADQIYYDENLVEIDETDEYDRRMKLTTGGRCIALTDDGRCGIYEKRPYVCRAFRVDGQRCKNYRL
jgi:Fe-S-cluster containining protein